MSKKYNDFKKDDRIDFLIIGAQKAGTSAMHYYLSQHPEISLGKKKELHFFDNDDHWNTEKIDYRKYHQYFDWSEKKIRGEVTPIYIYWENSLERIAKYHPNVKIIFSLRNPMLRAFSQYNMEFSRGSDKKPFCSTYQKERAYVEGLGKKKDRVVSYIDRGFYYKQIENVFSLFPSKNVFPIKYEQFKSDNEKTMNKIFQFLGVETINLKKRNIFSIRYKASFCNDQYREIQKTLRKDIKKVEKLLKWDCSDWLN